MKRLSHFTLLCALGALVSISSGAAPQSAREASPRRPAARSSAHQALRPGSSFDLDVSRLRAVLETVPEDERREQVADWTVLGTLAYSGRSQEEVRRALYDKVPRRDPALAEIAHFDYGTGRRVILGHGVVWLFHEESDPHPYATLARLADHVRMELGSIPATFRILRYRPELRNGAVNVTVLRDLPGQEFFTKECFGYVERVVRTADELAAWLEEVDDVTHVRLTRGGVELGGRRFAEARTAGVTIQDVAALYQAHQALAREHGEDSPAEPGFSLDPMWSPHGLAADLRSFLAPKRTVSSFGRSGPLGLPRPPPNRASLLDADMRSELLDRSPGSLRDVFGPAPDPFSSSPVLADVTRLVERAHDLVDRVKARGGDDASMSSAEVLAEDVVTVFPERQGPHELELGPDHAAILYEAIGRLEWARTGRDQAQAVAPLRQLSKDLSGEDDLGIQEVRFLELLSFALASNEMQCARYDGPLQGTQVGMTLFYTDLIAKLWASVDFHRSAPVDAVPGLLTLPRMPQVPAMYWSEEWRLSSTRIWFGPKPEGYAFVPDQGKVSFAHISTRVYSAGSNPTRPGDEEQPSESNRRVFSWWDRHFERIAAHEQQFHRQNQIMKWSIVTGLLFRASAVDTLEVVQVDRSQRFDRWLASRADLRYRGDIRMLPQERWITGTECLDRLASYSFAMAGTTGWISGGVSLGSERALLTGTQILEGRLPAALRRAGLSHSRSTPDVVETLRGTRFQLPAREARVVITPSSSAPLRAGGTELQVRQLSTTFTLPGPEGGGVTVRVGDTPLETLQIGLSGRGPQLTLQRGSYGTARDVTEAVAMARDVRATRMAELQGVNPWERLQPQPGVYLTRSRGKLEALLDGGRAHGAARESFVIGTGKIEGQRVLASTGEVGTAPLSPLLTLKSDIPKVSATRVGQGEVVAALRSKPWQELRVTKDGQVIRTFVDVAPPGPSVKLSGLGLEGEARATPGALYVKRGPEAPEVFEDLVTRERLTGERITQQIKAARRTPESARVELVSGRADSSAEALVKASQVSAPEVLELVRQVELRSARAGDAAVVRGFLRGRAELPSELGSRLSLAREKYALHTRLDAQGLRWREASPSEREVLLKSGQAYVEEAGPLRAMDADLAPGGTLGRVEARTRVVYEVLEEPVALELRKAPARMPTQLRDGSRTYSWRTVGRAAAASGGSSGDAPSSGNPARSPVYRIRLAEQPQQEPAPRQAAACAL